MGQRTDRGCLNCKRNSMKIKTLKILNYQLKLSGPQLSHLDGRPIFAAYMGMKKNGVCIGRQTMDTAPMRTNEICPSYFLPLHAHSRVIFEICRSYFLPPFPPGNNVG